MSKLIKISILMSVCTLLLMNTASAELDSHDKEALARTQSFLKDKAAREAVIKNEPNAQKQINQMNQMGMSGAQQNEVFNISADIFGQVTKDSKGDPAAMQKLLEQAQKNPEAFYKSLDPSSRDKIRSLGLQLEDSKNPQSPK